MTAVAGSWQRPVATFPAIRLARLTASWILFVSTLVGYLALGAYLSLSLHAMHGDAYSRVTNAYYVLFSRDPHLAAIGFVWPPLPSLIELMLVPLTPLWPPLVEHGLAAVIMSSIFMAGAVYQVSRTLEEFAVPWIPRLALVAAFALHPMVLYYGAIGTAEAPTLFFLVLTVRYIARWLSEPAIAALVTAGLGLAGAYLTRQEAMFSAVGAAGLVAIATMIRSDRGRRERLDAAVADVAILLAPFILAFVGWAAASFLVVGSPFPAFTSAYGNASQTAVWAAQGANELQDPLVVKAPLALIRLGALEVTLPLALGVAAIVCWRRRDPRCLAVIALLAPALLFMVVAYLTNTLAPWLRYFVLAIPLCVLLFGSAVGGLARRPGALVSRPGAPTASDRFGRSVGAVAHAVTLTEIVLAAIVALPVATVGILDRTVAVEESRDLAGLLSPLAAREDRPGAALRTFATEREIATYLDGLDLPRGSVLVDTFSGFAVVGQSARPDRFVITSDRDFRAALTDPRSFGVRYLLAPDVSGNGVLDAVNLAYPSLLRDGAGFAILERTFDGQGSSSEWRLYRVVPSDREVSTG